MRVTIDWSRDVVLPCGAEVDVDYRVTASVAADEIEVQKVEHVEEFCRKERTTALEVDDFLNALNNRDTARLDTALVRAANEKHESAREKFDASREDAYDDREGR